MAIGKRISDLPQASTLTGSEVFEVGQDGLSKQASLEAIRGYDATALEISAGVTIVNRFYQPGHVWRYKSGSLAVDGTEDWTAAIQAALDGSKVVYVPAGTYQITDTLVIGEYQTLYGDGNVSNIRTALDIEMLNLTDGGAYNVHIHDIGFENTLECAPVARPTITGNLTLGSAEITNVSSSSGLTRGIEIQGTGIPSGTFIRSLWEDGTLKIKMSDYLGEEKLATASGTGVTITPYYRTGATKFHLHLYNAGYTRIERVYIKGEFADNIDYSPLNHGGIWLDRDEGTLYFVNEISDCWLNHAQILVGTSDSNVKNTHVWGIGLQYAIMISAPGVGVAGCNASNGNLATIVIDDSETEEHGDLNHYINSNNIDSGGLVFDGHGILMYKPINVAVSANRINICNQSGIQIQDGVGVSITGNQFNNNNLEGMGFPDIDNIGITQQPNAISIVGNVATNNHEDSAVDPGLFIRERNLGFQPVSCSYTGNNISGTSYDTSANFGCILTLQTGSQRAKVSGNGGAGADTEYTDSFEGTLTTVTGTVTGTVLINRQGPQITLYLPSIEGAATGGAVGSVTITGMPATYRPGQSQRGFALVVDNSAPVSGLVTLDTSGVLTFQRYDLANFNAGGNRGVSAGSTLSYALTY